MNAVLVQQLAKVSDVVGWLTKRGDSVLRIEIDGLRARMPRIELANRPKGILSVETVEVVDGQTRRFREVELSGCRVEWRCD